jgi:4-amino-4-deoxy-L-arabinose transferase-like glycosyltransferase
MKKMVFALVLIIIGGAILRGIDLGKESLWTDEAFSLSHAQQDTLPQLITAVEGREAAPPGYYLTLHYWIPLFGSSAAAIRLLSVLFSILSLVTLFFITKEIKNTKTALLATSFMAITMLEIVYAQEARLYALFGFLSLLSAFLFIKILKKNKIRYYTAYGIVSVLALYTNYLMPFLFVLYTFAIILFNKHRNKELIRQWVYTHAFIGIAALPLIPTLAAQLSGRNAGLSATLIAKGLPPFLAQLGLGFFALPSLFLIIIVAAGLFLKDTIKNIHFNKNIFLMTVILAAGVYLYGSFFPLKPLPQPLTHSYFVIRHSFFLMPVIYICIARKVTTLSFKKAASIIAIILVINTAALVGYYNTPTKPQWKEATSIIPLHTTILLDNGGVSNTFLLNYYTKSNTVIPLSQVTRVTTDAMQTDTLSMITLNTEEFWLIEAKPRERGHYPEILDKQFKRETVEFYGITVHHYTQ